MISGNLSYELNLIFPMQTSYKEKIKSVAPQW